MPSATDCHLRSLRNALENAKPPYCSGTIDVDEKALLLFYGDGKGDGGRINMGNASTEDLQHLFHICSPATFGRNQEDVLDESYRKAAKLDEDRFATKLDTETSGLMEAIRYGLLEGDQGKRGFHAELYKLNIYDKGSFFKAHKDTPRGKAMFGSLVVAFPTAHEGGELIIRQDKKEWVFDSGRVISKKGSKCIAYAAFFSDIEHEVKPVKSGYRVTLTYNLYFDASKKQQLARPRIPNVLTIPPDVAIFKSALSSLIKKREVLKGGGSLGFGLFHQYPVSHKWALKDLKGCLKGRDAMIMQACNALSLKADLWFLYHEHDSYDGGYQFLSKDVVQPDTLYDEDLVEHVLESSNVRMINFGCGDEDEDSLSELDKILWVNDLKKFNVVESTFATYGNEPSMDCAYGKVCLIVDIGPPGDRSSGHRK